MVSSTRTCTWSSPLATSKVVPTSCATFSEPSTGCDRPLGPGTRSSTLLELGFTESESDPGLFSLQLIDSYSTFVLVYVDDMLLVSDEITKVMEVIGKLSKAFALKDMGEAAVFVGMEIDCDHNAGTLKVT